MPQITLVPNKHDNNISVRMVPQLPQPLLRILIGDMLGNVIDEQGAHRAPVVRACDSPVALLAGCVPDLRLDCLVVHLDASRGELNAYGRLAL